MNSKRFALTVAVLGMLVALLLALPAQAQFYDCDNLNALKRDGTTLYVEEQVWYDENCVEEEDDDDDDDNVEAELVEMVEDIPTMVTCPYLPPSVVVFGYVEGTQCQTVGPAGVGNLEVIQRDFIDAVDIWSYVNGGIDVCFRSAGSLVFLNAAYAPRMVVELDAFERNGMICGKIDGPGTVVLVRSGAPVAPPDPPAPATQPATNTLPTFDAIPLNGCLIKLVETLFLRAEPAGEIIGLVWQYSEVPAFEINGYWYKIEFEGQTGFVSRYHRKVLRGGCG